MLGAIDVPGVDAKQDGALGPRPVSGVGQPGEQLRIVLDHARATPDFDAAAVGEIEQEQKSAVVLRKIAQRDVLPVAGVVGEAERPVVEHLDEALRPAAVLDVGSAELRDGRQKRGVELADEVRKLRCDRIGEARSEPLGVAVRRAAFGLRALRCGWKYQVAVVGHCHFPSSHSASKPDNVGGWFFPYC